jgi:hypothetical protein
MATAKKKRNKDSGSNDSVIASRILQDIINNSSDTFRAFLQQQMGGGDIQAVPLAGGGPRRSTVQDSPVQGPQPISSPISDIPTPPSMLPTGPVQGPVWPQWPGDPRNQPGYGMIGNGRGLRDQSVNMPGIPIPNEAVPMPGTPRRYEDGSVAMPWDHPMPRWEPQSMSILDLLGIR